MKRAGVVPLRPLAANDARADSENGGQSSAFSAVRLAIASRKTVGMRLASQRGVTAPITGRIAAARKLAGEHHELEAVFADVCERARSGDWRVCDEIWDEFGRRLELHMRFEEETLFPDYRRESAESARIVDALTAEHDTLRARLFQIGVDIQLHYMRAEVIEAMVAALRQHARREDETLHPWLAAHPTRD